MSMYEKGDIVVFTHEDGEKTKLYYIDSFKADEDDNSKTILVLGGNGEELVYADESTVYKYDANINEKMLLLMVDQNQTLKVIAEQNKEILNAVSPKCEECGELLSDHNDDEDDEGEEDYDDSEGFEN